MRLLSADTADTAATATGDAGLFEGLFTRHYPRVHRVLSGLLGPEEADDAAQEVFLRLFHSQVAEQPDERIAGWLYRVAVNTAYNLLRSRRRSAARLERAGQLSRSEEPFQQAALNPAQAVSDAEEAALVRAALAALSETHRTILVLRQSGLSYAEVAAAAGVKTGSVGPLLARAEANLRQHYLRLAAEPPPSSSPRSRP